VVESKENISPLTPDREIFSRDGPITIDSDVTVVIIIKGFQAFPCRHRICFMLYN